MKISSFISVGENIHCTRIYKTNGKLIQKGNDESYSILYTSGGKEQSLRIPKTFTNSADWQNGKIKHCACAIWQANYGDPADRASAVDYLQNHAKSQEANGATYLDINVDEFSTDIEERVKLMQWTVKTVQESVKIPMSIDSSNPAILRSGLKACDPKRGKPMLNSISLERLSALELAKEFNAVVIASAAGENDLPTTVEGRMTNINKIVKLLTDAGLKLSDIHVDPLVFPISTDSTNGNSFLDTVKVLRSQFGADIHVAAGLSNISFGMPKRNLITQVFTYLAVEAGADGGIVDPQHVNLKVLNGIKPDSESFKLTKALLTGTDEFGMEFITATREGII